MKVHKHFHLAIGENHRSHFVIGAEHVADFRDDGFGGIELVEHPHTPTDVEKKNDIEWLGDVGGKVVIC